MRLTVNTDDVTFFRQILELLSGIPPLNKLRKRELDLLAMLMYYNYLYKDIDENLRWKIINNTATRKEIHYKLNMKEDIFNNNLSVVRKTGLLDKEGRITPMLCIYPGETFNLEFNFNINKYENG